MLYSAFILVGFNAKLVNVWPCITATRVTDRNFSESGCYLSSVGKVKYRSLVQPLVQHITEDIPSTPCSASPVKPVLKWGYDILLWLLLQKRVYIHTQSWSENNNVQTIMTEFHSQTMGLESFDETVIKGLFRKFLCIWYLCFCRWLASNKTNNKEIAPFL